MSLMTCSASGALFSSQLAPACVGNEPADVVLFVLVALRVRLEAHREGVDAVYIAPHRAVLGARQSPAHVTPSLLGLIAYR